MLEAKTKQVKIITRLNSTIRDGYLYTMLSTAVYLRCKELYKKIFYVYVGQINNTTKTETLNTLLYSY